MLDKLSGLIFAEDPSAPKKAPAKTVKPVSAVTAASVPSYVAAPQPAYPGVAVSLSGEVLTPDEKTNLDALAAEVFASGSSFLILQNVRKTMGNSANLQQVIAVIQATNASITPQKISSDIEHHISTIQNKRGDFEHAVEAVRKEKVADVRARAAELTAQNERDAEAIQRRAAQITQMEQEAAASDADLNHKVARFAVVEDQLLKPLRETQQLLSSI